LSATLHPTVPVHSPLTFSLIDRLTARTIAQCIYRIEQPEGRHYAGRPANAAEALARRSERFEDLSSGVPVPMPGEEINPVFPGTLDLRIPPPGPDKHFEALELLP
jgi:uncharacterized protein (DUF2126 family)